MLPATLRGVLGHQSEQFLNALRGLHVQHNSMLDMPASQLVAMRHRLSILCKDYQLLFFQYSQSCVNGSFTSPSFEIEVSGLCVDFLESVTRLHAAYNGNHAMPNEEYYTILDETRKYCDVIKGSLCRHISDVQAPTSIATKDVWQHVAAVNA